MKKFLCLAYYDPAKFDALEPDARKAIVSQCPAHDAKLAATGALVLHGSLAAPAASVGLRARRGPPLVFDGPFTETKEQVGGFFLIEAETAEDATRIASLHPAANLGETVGWGIEIRPIEYFRQFSGGPD